MTIVNPKSISGINSITTGSGSDNLLTIHTSDASSTERVRINSDGDVIVGSGITVSPDGDIFATGVTTSTTFSGNFSGGTVSGTTGTFSGDVTTSGGDLTVTGTNPIIHLTDTNDNSDFQLNVNGGVFQVYDYSNTAGRLLIASDGTVSVPNDLSIADKIVHTGDTHTAMRFTGNDTITFDTGGTSRVQITDATTDIGNDVSIADKIIHTGDTNTAIRFPAADTVSVETGASERARINSDGQLLVGTTESSPYANRTGMFNKNGGNYVSITTDSSNDCGIVFGDGTGQTTANYETYMAHSNSTNDFTIYVNQGSNTRYLRLKSATGHVEIGSGNLVLASGAGIDFSATGGPTNGSGSSELFDDYEEGTFSPGVNGGTTNTQTFDSNGRYTKIGRQVFCQFLLQYSGAGTGAHVSYSGLPFTSVNNSSRGGGTVLWTNIPFNVSSAVSVTVNANDTAIYLYYNMDDNLTTGSGGFTNKAIYVRVTYEAA